MRRIIATFAVVLAAIVGPGIVIEAGATWSGNWWTCYRWADSNEGHMRCRTDGTWTPRLYYQSVVTFRSTKTGATTRVWGMQRSVDGSSWGSWSSVASPYGSYSRLVKSSYWITW